MRYLVTGVQLCVDKLQVLKAPQVGVVDTTLARAGKNSIADQQQQ
jgi:hypothetical protein